MFVTLTSKSGEKNPEKVAKKSEENDPPILSTAQFMLKSFPIEEVKLILHHISKTYSVYLYFNFQ